MILHNILNLIIFNGIHNIQLFSLSLFFGLNGSHL